MAFLAEMLGYADWAVMADGPADPSGGCIRVVGAFPMKAEVPDWGASVFVYAVPGLVLGGVRQTDAPSGSVAGSVVAVELPHAEGPCVQASDATCAVQGEDSCVQEQAQVQPGSLNWEEENRFAV